MNPSIFSYSDLSLIMEMLQSYSTYVEARIEDLDLEEECKVSEANHLEEELKRIDYIFNKNNEFMKTQQT